MTLDEAVNSAARQLDVLFEKQQGRQTHMMIECGVDDAVATEMLTRRRVQYATWRPHALDEIRAMLLARDLSTE